MSVIYHLFKTIDSTNQYLKNLPHDTQTHVCRADMQTHGRGRFQRQWESPNGGNLYLSIRYPYLGNIADLNGFSLVVSLSLLKILKQAGISEPIDIKWPNDLLWQGKKLAGILIELSPNAIIIGIGLNITASSQKGCCLCDITGTSHDRERIITLLIKQLEQDFILFKQHGFSIFQSAWQTYHYLQNKPVTITQPAGKLEGIAQGVDEHGRLIVLDHNGEKNFIAAGEASLGSGA